MADEIQPDTSWSDLSTLDPEARIAAMRERFAKLAGADAADRDRESEAMILAEYTLEDEHLHALTVSRLRSWMALLEDNPEQARIVSGAYDTAFQRVPGEIAMRHATVVQMLAREEFGPEDIDVLYELIPNLVGHVPRASQEALESAAATERAAVAARRAGRKPWWKFW